MSSNLIINKSHIDGETVNIFIEGRLDAISAEQLSSSLEEDIRSGHYNISLDMASIDYISSAGIRVLVKIYKQLNFLNGQLTLSQISENVKSVLDLAGLMDMFYKADFKTIKKQNHTEEKQIINAGIDFNIVELNESSMKCTLIGNPDNLHSMNFEKEDFQPISFNGDKYGIGMASINNNNIEFGEFIGIHDFIAYLPPTFKRKPDFMVKTGNLIPEANILYGIICEGSFSHNIRFDAGKSPTKLSALLEGFSDITSFSTYLYVMIAETEGLIGASINKIEPKKNIYEYPEIKEKIYFNTEPVYEKMLTIVVGIVSKDTKSEIAKFLRPLSANTNLITHSHAAVFDYMPLKKQNKNLSEMIKDLTENKEMKDILHLINDDRQINGSGESMFTKGHCSIANLKI